MATTKLKGTKLYKGFIDPQEIRYSIAAKPGIVARVKTTLHVTITCGRTKATYTYTQGEEKFKYTVEDRNGEPLDDPQAARQWAIRQGLNLIRDGKKHTERQAQHIIVPVSGG